MRATGLETGLKGGGVRTASTSDAETREDASQRNFGSVRGKEPARMISARQFPAQASFRLRNQAAKPPGEANGICRNLAESLFVAQAIRRIEQRLFQWRFKGFPHSRFSVA